MEYQTRLVGYVGKAESLLDAGCGDGTFMREYMRRFPDAIVHGFDVSYQGAIPQIDQADIRDPLPYPDKSFDIVLVAAVLLLIPGSLDGIIDELKRVGKKVIILDLHDTVERDLGNRYSMRFVTDFTKWATSIEPFPGWPGEGITGSLITIQ